MTKRIGTGEFVGKGARRRLREAKQAEAERRHEEEAVRSRIYATQAEEADAAIAALTPEADEEMARALLMAIFGIAENETR